MTVPISWDFCINKNNACKVLNTAPVTHHDFSKSCLLLIFQLIYSIQADPAKQGVTNCNLHPETGCKTVMCACKCFP